jgi:hypothetical protein
VSGNDLASPRIGILVVAYNAESTLRATLDRVPVDFRERTRRSCCRKWWPRWSAVSVMP